MAKRLKDRTEPKIAVIGAGPAGCEAALQLCRYGFDTTLFERSRIGGLARNANRIDNYLGFPRGISGRDLCRLMKEHVARFVKRFVRDEVVSVVFHDAAGRFAITTRRRRRYFFDIVIAASGTIARPIDPGILFGTPGSINGRLFYDIASLPKTGKKTIAIVGGGDAAFDYALSLMQRNKAIILSRNILPSCLDLLWHDVMDCPGRRNVEYIGNVNIYRMDFNDKGVCIGFRDKIDPVNADYVLAAIGRNPELSYLKLTPGQKSKAVKAGRLFYAGDVANGQDRQVAIAAGDGLRVAMAINNRRRFKARRRT